MTGIISGSILFDRYKIVRILGKGGSSIVYLAENLRVGNLVAIKVVSKNDKEMNLVAEKDILKELRHPSIPIIMDIEEDEGEIYLIEEYVEGISLKELKLSLNEEEVIHIMRQLCDVLSYLHTSHSEPIIYRDLKPDNIIRMHNGHIKLVDFGIAKRYKANQHSDTVSFGTKGYAAPEQYGMSKTDVRTDIFSLGVCMYYLLSGKNLSISPYRIVPLRGENDKVSVEFEKIIIKCTQSVPSKRYQHIKDLIEDMERLGKKETHQGDVDTMREKSQKLIHISGIKSGIGVTHLCLMMARYYKEQMLKVGVIEYHQSEVFSQICVINDDILEKRHYFNFKGIDYYPFYYYGGYEQILDNEYDVLIVDAGSTLDHEGVRHPNSNMDKILVCGLKDWEIDSFEEVYLSVPDKSCYYLFNFAGDSNYRALRETIKGLKTYQVPFNPDPYVLEGISRQMFERMMSDQLTQAEGTKGSVYEAKRFIKEKLKKFEGAKQG